MGNKILKNHNINKGSSPKITELQQDTASALEVILVYPHDLTRNWILPYSHYILSTALKNIGIPSKIYGSDDKNLHADIITPQSRFKIFGLWSYYESLPDMVDLCNKIKHWNPNSSFVVLWWQWTIDADSRKYALNSGIDAINIGHAQPFIDFMKKIDESKVRTRAYAFEATKQLLATLQNPDVKKWKFPYFESFPLLWWKGKEEWGQEYATIHIPHYLNCPNACDFCSQMKTSWTQISDGIVQKLKKISLPIETLSFEWPTFEWKLVESFRKMMEAVEEKQGYKPNTSIVMDSKQFQEKNYKHTMILLEEFNAKKVHIGINSIDWETASAVGRKNCGKVRTDEELQWEIAGVLKFVKETKIKDIKLDMLLTPFDTTTTIEKIIGFYKEILAINKTMEKNAWLYLSPLVPYPGSKLYDTNKDKISFTGYRQLGSSRMYDPTLRKYDEKMFGTKFLRYFSAPFITSNNTILTHKDDFRANYLRFLALTMTYQYLQWISKKEDMDILYPEYEADIGVNAVFDATVTQSVDLKPGLLYI